MRLVRSYMQLKSGAPLVTIRDMVNKLQAYMLPERQEAKFCASSEKCIAHPGWVAAHLQLNHSQLRSHSPGLMQLCINY